MWEIHVHLHRWYRLSACEYSLEGKEEGPNSSRVSHRLEFASTVNIRSVTRCSLYRLFSRLTKPIPSDQELYELLRREFSLLQKETLRNTTLALLFWTLHRDRWARRKVNPVRASIITPTMIRCSRWWSTIFVRYVTPARKSILQCDNSFGVLQGGGDVWLCAFCSAVDFVKDELSVRRFDTD